MHDGALVPAFAPGCRAHVVSGERVIVLSGSGSGFGGGSGSGGGAGSSSGGDRQLLLSGRAYALLVPLIDGRTPDDALVHALAAELPAAVVQLALLRLQGHGVIVLGPPSLSSISSSGGPVADVNPAALPLPARGELSVVGVGVAEAVVERMAGVVRDGESARGQAVSAVADAAVTAGPSRRGLIVPLLDDYLREELDALAVRCIAADVALLPIRADGAEWWLGPHLDGASAAPLWRLLRMRLHANHAADLDALRQGATFPLRGAPDVPAATVLEQAVAHAAEAIEQTLRGEPPAALRDGILVVDHEQRECASGRGPDVLGDATAGSPREAQAQSGCATGDPRGARTHGRWATGSPCEAPAPGDGTTHHRIAVVSETGVEKRAAPAFGASLPPLRLDADRRTRAADSGRRASAPAETLARMLPLLSPITGIAAGLERVPAVPGTHVYATAGTLDWPAEGAADRRPVFRTGALGKGLTDAQAQASCIGETIELVSARFTGAEPRRRARWSEVAGIAIHPRELLLVSEAQYAEPPSPTWDGVPPPFDEPAAIEWAPLVSLVDGATRWLPAAYCWFDYEDPLHPAAPFATANANGCAAGGTLAEATLQGLLELIERDACALWWYSGARRPQIDLDSVGDPRLLAIRDAHAAAGRTLTLLDLTADTGVAVVVAVASSRAGVPLATGRGCHLDPAIAITRAITELSQGVAIASPGDAARPGDRAFAADASRAGDHADRGDAPRPGDDDGALPDLPHLRPSGAAPVRLADLPDRRRDDAAEEVEWCVELLAGLGHDVLVLDTTRAELGFPAVRVVVPGLRPLLPRLAPGRLYDVPPRLGWIPRRLREDELVPHAFVS